jgi:DNA-binding beta-propeller fold protein YncE/mono/diheme cytochrome c family protein
MTRRYAMGIMLGVWGALALLLGRPDAACRAARAASEAAEARDRSPVDVALTPDGQWLLTANQTSHSVSLVRESDGQVTSEVACGRRPTAIAVTPDGRRTLVSAANSGELRVFEIDGSTLRPAGAVYLGFEPHGIAIAPDGSLAYVALTGANEVALVDLGALRVVERIAVGRWPRYLCLTPDGTRLAVGASGDGGISVVDTVARKKLYDTKFQGLNIGQLAASADGTFAYFPWMAYTDRPITVGNIREGWVMGNRVARVRLDGPARREAMALDPRGKAVADPHGVALSANEKWLALSASGTHELVAFRLGDLPLAGDGPGDHLKAEIAADGERFFRVPLSGRPMGMRFDRSGARVYVANYLNNSVQVVNFQERRLEREIPLGGPASPSLVRRGETIFFDALRSTDGWYSCHSCHYEGHTNAVTMDTKNDGSFGTYKMVLSLRNLRHTGPWFWHGRQDDLHAALVKSLTDTMQGPPPSDAEVDQLAAFLETLEAPPNSWRQPDGTLSEAARRGQQLFASEAANCAACHAGPHYTDGEIHDVGLGSKYDAYKGFNTPSLSGIANRVRYLHNGRALSLDDLLGDLHSPAKVSHTRELTDEERADLVAYLQSL